MSREDSGRPHGGADPYRKSLARLPIRMNPVYVRACAGRPVVDLRSWTGWRGAERKRRGWGRRSQGARRGRRAARDPLRERGVPWVCVAAVILACRGHRSGRARQRGTRRAGGNPPNTCRRSRGNPAVEFASAEPSNRLAVRRVATGAGRIRASRSVLAESVGSRQGQNLEAMSPEAIGVVARGQVTCCAHCETRGRDATPTNGLKHELLSEPESGRHASDPGEFAGFDITRLRQFWR